MEGQRKWVEFKHSTSDLDADKPVRLDKLISTHMGISSQYAQFLIREGHVLIQYGKNKAPITKKTALSQEKLQAISSFHVYLEQRNLTEKKHQTFESTEATSTQPPVNVIYEDDFVIAVNKPPGYAVHKAGASHPEESTMLYAVQRYVLEHETKPILPINVGLPHRLDKETSGVLLFGKNTMALQSLGRQFADYEKYPSLKQYCAIAVAMFPRDIVAKTCDYDEERSYEKPIIIENPLVSVMSPYNVGTKRRKMMTHTVGGRSGEYFHKKYVYQEHLNDSDVEAEEEDKNKEREKLSRSVCHVVEVNDKDQLALVQVRIKSGRTHQIRSHLCSIEMPVLGDYDYYATLNSSTPLRITRNVKPTRIMLHCQKMSFFHPETGKRIIVQAPVDNEMVEIAKRFFSEESVNRLQEGGVRNVVDQEMHYMSDDNDHFNGDELE
jgi:23S rRNA-/tRNA-specific pseudouridylate synthase